MSISQSNDDTVSLSDYTFNFSGLNINSGPNSIIKIVFPSDFSLDQYQVDSSFDNSYTENDNILYIEDDININGSFSFDVKKVINGVYSDKNYQVTLSFYDS